MVRIEWIYPFLPTYCYLPFALVCKTWKAFLEARGVRKISTFPCGGSLEYLTWATDAGAFSTPKVYALVAETGRLETIQWAYQRGYIWDGRLVCQAAKFGHLHILEWAERHKIPIGDDVGIAAATGGHIHILLWLHKISKGEFHPRKYWITAIAAGQLTLVRWLKQEYGAEREASGVTMNLSGPIYIAERMSKIAVEWTTMESLAIVNARFNILEWLHGKGVMKGGRALSQCAARQGNVKIVDWLWQREYLILDETVSEAAFGFPWERERAIAMWKWLRARGCPVGRLGANYAAECGDIETLNLAYESGVELDPSIWSIAIWSGNFHVLDWAETRVSKEVDCESCPLKEAAAIGNIALMEQLLRQGFELTQYAFDAAVRQPDLNVLEWLLARHCPKSRRVWFSVIMEGTYQVFEWLQQHHFPMDSWKKHHWFEIAQFSRFDFLERMWEKGEVDSELYIGAMREGNVKVLEWARVHEISLHPEISKWIHYGMREGHSLELLEWVEKNGICMPAEVATECAEMGNLLLLRECTRIRGKPWKYVEISNRARRADKGPYLHIIAWLAHNGEPISTREYNLLKEHGSRRTRADVDRYWW